MHVTKVAQLFFRCLHLALALAEFYVNCNSEIFELIHTPDLTKFYMVYCR